MKPLLARLTLISSCALMSTLVSAPAFAQATSPPRATPGIQAATPTLAAPASAPKPVAVAANARVASPASVTRVTAAGSVIILADGIVANATIAQILPPAPGFVYER
ncbi:MAG: hypothetical protein JNN03_03915 [Rubrivivax sp.]|nr:hypothetical protein [Rubrivivax sp.]